MHNPLPENKLKLSCSPLFISCGLLLFLVCVELAAILILNEGHFSFSLDDPYIHLALAKNMLTGSYGINPGEFSAPSSSILWPIIIAPLTFFNQADYGVLMLNAVFMLLTLFTFYRIIGEVEEKRAEGNFTGRTKLLLLTLFIFLANGLGLIFIGMEHQLQVLLACLIFYGLLRHVNTNEIPPVLWLAIIISPLVRYESLSVSVAALVYLGLSHSKMRSLAVFFIIIGLLGLFSYFLLSSGVSYLPDSVMVKSDPAASGISKILVNFWSNLHYPKGFTLLFGAMLFLHTAWFRYVDRNHRVLYFSLALAILAHLALGRIGWYFRYELYIWAFTGCGLFYLFFVPVLTRENKWAKRISRWVIYLFITVAVFEHLVAAITTPIAASNIYHQQHQMALFVRNFYQKPVAVNDLGLVAYKNDVYILDLWGLGSNEARQLRSQETTGWMHNLAEKKGVELAMIYHTPTWFSSVPEEWIKIGELKQGGPIVVSWFPVSFFATHEDSVEEITEALQKFADSLPDNSHFDFQAKQGDN